MTSAPEPGRHVQTATMETSRAAGVGLVLERPSRDGTSDTSSCQAPGRAGVKGGWLAAQRPSGCRWSRGRRSVRCGRRNRAYFQAVYFQTSGGGEAPHPWTVGGGLLLQDSWQVQGVLYELVLGGGRRCTINDRDGWCCSGVSFRAQWEPDFLTARAKYHRQGRLRHRNFPSLETRS